MANPIDHHGHSNPYYAANVATVSDGLERFVRKHAKKLIIDMLKLVAQRMIDIIDGRFVPVPPYYRDPESGNTQYPVWTGTMRDATGVAIYDDGVCISYLPTAKACAPQHDPPYENIVGREWLRDAIREGTAHFSKGLWIVLFSAVPYANQVNTVGSPAMRGQGYFDRLSVDFFNDVVGGLKAIRI